MFLCVIILGMVICCWEYELDVFFVDIFVFYLKGVGSFGLVFGSYFVGWLLFDW